MFIEHPHTVTMCTVRRHPEGGWTPVLHMTGTAGPEPHADAISFPDVLTAVRWARNHYGSMPLAIDDSAARTRPA